MKFASQLTGGGGSDDTFEDTLSGGGGSTAAMDALLGGGQSLYGAKGLLYSMNDGRLYLAGDAVIDGTITTPKLAAQAVTAVKIDVADLFAQDITFTNAIQSDGFVSGSGGHGVKLDAINDTYEFHGSLYADSGVFSGVLDAASGSFGSFGPSTGIEIKDGAIIFTDDNIFGGTSKGVIEQGSLGNIGITAESAVVLKTTNGPSVQINLFNKFLPSTGLLLGDSGNPWEEGYVKKMYIQDELRLGSTTWSGMPAVQGFSFFSIHTENNVFDALSPFLAVGEKKGCVGYYDGAEVAYIHRGSQTTIDIYTAGGTMRRRFTDGSSTSVGTFAVMLVV
jgi:hypothetical protein